MNDSFLELNEAVRAGDILLAKRVLGSNPGLSARLNEPTPNSFDAPMILAASNAKNLDMVDLLIGAGADINARSRWWAGGFGVLDTCDPALAAQLMQRGARLDAHSAARLGFIDKLREFLDKDPGLVNARGGDGKAPLHFASSVEIAKYLLDRGAEIDMLDVDHESTPAQHLVCDHPDVARFLVTKGCKTDILLASAVGAVDLVRRYLDDDPASIHTRVTPKWFPMKNRRAGGTIYQWTLGGGNIAHIIAYARGHADVFDLLMERSPEELRLAVAAAVGNDALVDDIIRRAPDVVSRLTKEHLAALGHAAEGNRTSAVRSMLRAGWPVDAPYQSRQTAIHWAAWHGNIEMVRAILPYAPDLTLRDAEFHASPLEWANHGCDNSWHRKTGDYPAVIDALTAAAHKEK